MRKTCFFAGLICCALFGLASCAPKQDKRVIIYSSTEDFRTEHMQGLLKEQFPGYDITIQVLSTGNHAAKIKAEGTATEADIIVNLETSYLEGLTDVLADLSAFDASEFLPELVPAHHKYLPWEIIGGGGDQPGKAGRPGASGSRIFPGTAGPPLQGASFHAEPKNLRHGVYVSEKPGQCLGRG
jgi:iron(III) transport system substrate-binding protein